MNPRLKSSKKWTSFPKEYLEQIQGAFNENFAIYLKNAEIILEGRIYTDEITLRVGYREEGRLSQANFEISMNYSQEKKDAMSRIHNCIDAAASMMLEYLENDGAVDFPYVWKEIPFQGTKLYMQFNSENSDLESEANKLLGVDEDTLLTDEEEIDEDALSRAEIDEEISPARDEEKYDDEDEEDLDDEDDGDDSDDSGPRMFSGKKNKVH